jgi:hypothetical protein
MVLTVLLAFFVFNNKCQSGKNDGPIRRLVGELAGPIESRNEAVYLRFRSNPESPSIPAMTPAIEDASGTEV